MIPAADPPPLTVTVPVDKPANVVVISRDTRSEIIASKDTPLALIKAGKTEDALLRQAIFLTSTVSVEGPAAGAGRETMRWTHQSYLQRQLCVSSITGQFSCAVAEVEELTEKGAGEAPFGEAAPGSNTAAEAGRITVATALRSRAAALFEDNRRLKFLPILKAAGVSIQRPPGSVRPVRR